MKIIDSQGVARESSTTSPARPLTRRVTPSTLSRAACASVALQTPRISAAAHHRGHARCCYYFVYSTLRLATPDSSRFRWFLCNVIAWAQWLAIPTLLIWSLNKFSIDADANSGWVQRTFGGKRADFQTVQEWIFGSEGLLQSASIGAWDKTLRYSTPVFQIAEGFCSLLVIQAAGQITRWVVNKERGDSWMV